MNQMSAQDIERLHVQFRMAQRKMKSGIEYTVDVHDMSYIQLVSIIVHETSDMEEHILKTNIFDTEFAIVADWIEANISELLGRRLPVTRSSSQ